MRHFVACLDVWAPAVREAVRRVAPPELELHFAQSYGEAEQLALVENAELILAGWAAVTGPMLGRAKKLRRGAPASSGAAGNSARLRTRQ